MFRCYYDFAAGQTESSLYNASEALRLSSSLFSLMSSGAGTAPSSQSPSSNPDVNPKEAANSSVSIQQDSDAVYSNLDTADAVMQDAESLSIHEAAENAVPEAAQPSRVRQSLGGAQLSGAEGVGYWQVTWLYLTSLLKLGEVYEVAGSHEDAVHAFKEGLELVSHKTPSPKDSMKSLHMQIACQTAYALMLTIQCATKHTSQDTRTHMCRCMT